MNGSSCLDHGDPGSTELNVIYCKELFVWQMTGKECDLCDFIFLIIQKHSLNAILPLYFYC